MSEHLPELRLKPGLLDRVRYAAAMWEFQRLHFDHEWAREEGLERAIVQGPLLGNYLLRTVQEAIPAGYEVASLSWRNLAVVHVDENLRCGGEWSGGALDGRRAADLWIRDAAGTTVMRGSAVIRPARGGAP
jgi:hydroxyacyl-ACP dehydratase HTD2-like protein with hotdog domain